MKLLISAYACEPNRGSEQEVGWKWATEMSRIHDVTVVTQEKSRCVIENELQNSAYDNCKISFVYFQLPDFIYRLKSKFDFFTWPYYAAWQFFVISLLIKIHSEKSFSLIHHVTFASFRVPIWIKRIGIPVVYGPVGGSDKAPTQLLFHGFGISIFFKD